MWIEPTALKGTVRPDWICMRVVPLDRPGKEHQPLYVFLIFLFKFLIFKITSKFWAASCKKASNPPAGSVHGLHVLKPRSFSPNRVPKMQERYQLFFGLRLVSKESHHSVIQTKIQLHFGGFFHQLKVRQPIGRQDSMQTVIWTSRRL